jgi:hypothetical protein
MHSVTHSVLSSRRGGGRHAVPAAFAVLTVDVGHLFTVKGELQNAVALAGAAAMVTETEVDPQAGVSAAGRGLSAYPVLGSGMKPAAGDIRTGRYDDPLNPNSAFVPTADDTANTVTVTAGRRTAPASGRRNGSEPRQAVQDPYDRSSGRSGGAGNRS